MDDKHSIYHEQVTSKWTEALFLALTLLFTLLFLFRLNTQGIDPPVVVLFCFSALFLFYSINFTTLIIRISQTSLILTFGIFTWTIPRDNIQDCQPDDNLPLLMKYGGAGIHFMLIHGRYRASFNFLEHPRVVIRLKKQTGPVRDISFSTRQPDELIRILQVL